MNRKLIFALFVLLLAGLVSACNGMVPSVTVEPTAVTPTEVPPTAVPSPTPTVEPTAEPTMVPSPTPTPTLVPLAEWAVANGFQQRDSSIAGGEYYELVEGRIAFWVQSYDGLREIAVRIPNNAPQAERDEALNTWVRNVSGLLTPAIAEAAAARAPNLEPYDPFETDREPIVATPIDGYAVAFDAWRWGGDTVFIVSAGPATAVDPNDGYYRLLFESVEPIARNNCLAVVPQTGQPSEEEFGSWMGQYLDGFFERFGEDPLLQGLEPGIGPQSLIAVPVPQDEMPRCIVLLFSDTTNGEEFLIYETAEGLVRVPFTAPAAP